MSHNNTRFRIGAVSYLNTVPLVWGMLHGDQQDQVDLSFSLPSLCAVEVGRGQTDIGLVPVAEIARQGFLIVPGVGIAATGPVRSILLFSKVPWKAVKTLAADSSSRTSVELARVILRERFGADPVVLRNEPNLEAMMQTADAALIIGDPALRIEPNHEKYKWLDLAAEWVGLTGLPMVFAAWAGKPGIPVAALQEITVQSYQYGKERLQDIVEQEYAKRRISKDLAGRYLREHIHFELGSREQQGLETFFSMAGLVEAAA
ncbi:MAG: menaquinone biosynthesis protein [Acidobacteriota bacterium]|nr:menaquinone biosynthesis protein [Acidobacteriota bacterium]